MVDRTRSSLHEDETVVTVHPTHRDIENTVVDVVRVAREAVGLDAAELFHDLGPDAQLVLRACAVLDHSSLSLVAAAAALVESSARAAEVVAGLAADGWGVLVDDQLDITPEAWPFLQRLARLTPLDYTRVVIENVADGVEHAMTGATPLSAGILDDVLGVLRAANRHEMPQLAVRVATVAWHTIVPGDVGPDTDLTWWRAMAEEGEQAASGSREPRLLAEFLDSSARVYSAAGDWQAAEVAWVRALYLMDKLGDDDEYTRYLELLASTYRAGGQATPLTETLIELAERYGRDDEPAKAATALAGLGVTMLASGRFDSAILYLTRADRLLAALPQTPDLLVQRAVILSDLGTAHIGREAVNKARICFYEALTLVVVDDEVAQRIRDLQAKIR